MRVLFTDECLFYLTTDFNHVVLWIMVVKGISLPLYVKFPIFTISVRGGGRYNDKSPYWSLCLLKYFVTTPRYMREALELQVRLFRGIICTSFLVMNVFTGTHREHMWPQMHIIKIYYCNRLTSLLNRLRMCGIP